MKTIPLQPKILTEANFKQFGQVISINHKSSKTINSGFAEKFCDLAEIKPVGDHGKTTLNIFVCKKRSLPLTIDMLEQHPHFNQSFIPQNEQNFLVVVAPAGENFMVNEIEAFRTNGLEGVNIFAGVWHYPLISFHDASKFIVIEQNLPEDSGLDACIEKPITDCILQIKEISC